MSRDVESLSIGDLAVKTGIGVGTIRAWEQRYGRPVPQRLSSGHRRYSSRDVSWLHLVSEALKRGMRPSAVVPLSDAALTRALAERRPVPPRAFGGLEDCLAAIRRFDRAGVRKSFARWGRALPPQGVVLERVAPLLEQIGQDWANGTLDVRHEHFATVLLEDFLGGLGNERKAAPGGLLILATLPGERHGLGVHMAAVFARLAGRESVVLGTEVPIAEIVAAAKELRAPAIAISISLASGGVDTDRHLAELRARLDRRVAIVVGGSGARGVRRGPAGITYVDGLPGFDDWLRTPADPLSSAATRRTSRQSGRSPGPSK